MWEKLQEALVWKPLQRWVGLGLSTLCTQATPPTGAEQSHFHQVRGVPCGTRTRLLSTKGVPTEPGLCCQATAVVTQLGRKKVCTHYVCGFCAPHCTQAIVPKVLELNYFIFPGDEEREHREGEELT